MSQIQEIKDALSIVEIIGEKIQLTSAGNYYKGLCPFHHEKTPSFFVNENLGFYKCFGCGEHGDIFNFLQKYDNLSFKEALEILAQKAGITLETQNYHPQDKLKERVLALLHFAQQYFHHNLLHSPDCQLMRTYLKKRQIYQKTQSLFQLGASKNEWQDLTNLLLKENFTSAEILASGLVVQKKTGQIYDRFRGRLIFPLKNHRGQTVGFSGRAMTEEKNVAKYINSPETLLYHKSKMLYGLYELNQSIKKAGEIIIVEGEFDVLSSVQAQIDYAVAIKGSALTADHARLISRFVKKIILALDADRAGIEATKRAIKILQPEQLELKIIMLAYGEDPDQLAQKQPAEWRTKVKQALSVYDFFLMVILNKYNLNQIDDQKKSLQELAEIFALIDNKIEYEYYLKKLAQKLNQKVDDVRQDLEKWQQLGRAPLPPIKKVVNKIKKITKLTVLEAYVWFLFLHCLDQKELLKKTEKTILAIKWSNKTAQQLSTYYQQFLSSQTPISLKNFKNFLPGDFQEKVTTLFLNKNFINNLEKTDLEEEWQKITTHLKEERKKKDIQPLQKKLTLLEYKDHLSSQEEEERQALLVKINEIKKS